MLLKTAHLGELEIDEQRIIHFPNGIPAFETVKQFIIVDDEEPTMPFKWLQSVDKPDLAFVIINPFLVKQDYDFDVKDEVLKEIQLESPDALAVFCIVTVPEDLNQMTINLKAPVMIHVEERKGMQVILDTDKYTVRHYVLDELKKSREGMHHVSIGQEEGAVYSHK